MKDDGRHRRLNHALVRIIVWPDMPWTKVVECLMPSSRPTNKPFIAGVICPNPTYLLQPNVVKVEYNPGARADCGFRAFTLFLGIKVMTG